MEPVLNRFINIMDVRYRDLDALGHVNNAVMLTYVEQTRLEWWSEHLQGRPFKELGFLIARTEIDYRKPVLYGDRVRIELWCDQAGTSSFSNRFRICRDNDGVVLAEGASVLVMLDFKTERPRPIPRETLAWLRGQAG